MSEDIWEDAPDDAEYFGLMSGDFYKKGGISALKLTPSEGWVESSYLSSSLDCWPFSKRPVAEPEAVGVKYDAGKPDMALMPPHSQLELAKVLTFGASKYGPNNWRQLENLEQRYISAALRHINAYQKGEALDDESGLHHLAHAQACLAFITEVEIERQNRS